MNQALNVISSMYNKDKGTKKERYICRFATSLNLRVDRSFVGVFFGEDLDS
jgi:hypothetical protein